MRLLKLLAAFVGAMVLLFASVFIYKLVGEGPWTDARRSYRAVWELSERGISAIHVHNLQLYVRPTLRR